MQAICNSTNHLWAMLFQLGFKFPASFALYEMTSKTSDQAAKYDSKWRRAVLNFGPFWRGISVGSDAL